MNIVSFFSEYRKQSLIVSFSPSISSFFKHEEGNNIEYKLPKGFTFVIFVIFL